jgi:hypothetical protein
MVVALHQNAYLRENCIRRGVPAVEVMCPKLAVFSISVNDGALNDGWFQRLKKSAPKRTDCPSVIRNLLVSEKSQFCWKGPR